MSLIIAQDLLRQYNKKSPYNTTSSIDSTADQSNRKFGTWSYANMYDALYDKYSQNKNFNMNMWQQAVKLGEQDQYLAFLEQNKDNTLSDQFYDPQYYDYESMMMEMFLPFADNTKVEKYTQDVFDQATGKWVTEDIGEMTQRQYYQYLLSNVREARAAEIERDIEQSRKDQLGFLKQLGGDINATLGEFAEGLLSGLVGIVDFVAAVGTGGLLPYAMNDFEGNYLDAFVDYFGENGLTAAEKRSVRAALDEYERTHTHFRDIDGNITGVGKYFAGIANSIGMMVPAIVANYLTAGAYSLTWVGTTTFYASIFSSNMHENATDVSRANSPSWLKITNAAVKTGIEAIVEWGLGKMLGGTIQNKAMGIAGRNIGASFIKSFGKTSGLKYFFKSAGQEGLEEFLQDFSTNCADQFTDLIYEGYGNTGVTFQTLIDSLCIGMLSSMFMGGGRIALSATSSAIRNAKNPGSGDLLIETKDGPQKVTGFNRLQYSQILSDFQQAVNELKHGKIRVNKNIDLAQEVYGAISAISQFYSSFDAERIKNCEMLLDRVVKAEKSAFEMAHPDAAAALSPETVDDILKNDKKAVNRKTVRQIARQEAQTFGTYVEYTFREMVGGTALRHAERLHAAADKLNEELEKGGVTKATSFVNTDGDEIKVNYQKKSQAILDVENQLRELSQKGKDNLAEIRKGFEWVITVDGHVACETDGFLFVSEAWLENYSTSDIYKYLEQTRVLKKLTTDDDLAPMIKTLIAFDKEFTGQTDVDAERAMMDFLFNESVYQAFLLSNAGKNLHEYKDFIFKVHDAIINLANASAYHRQVFKGKQSQHRINLLEQISQQIKDTWRKPTIKAILNWRLTPQSIGADSILSPADREKIAQFQNRQRVLSGNIENVSAYEHLKEEIIADADFDDRELDLVRKSGTGVLSVDEEIEARALLEEADRRMTRYDFEISPRYSLVESFLDRTKDEYMNLMALRQTGEVDISLFGNIVYSLYDNRGMCIDPRASHSKGFLQALEAYGEKAEALFQHELTEITEEDVIPMINLGVKIYERALQELSGDKHQSEGLGAFTIPYQAAAIAMNDGDVAGAQFVTDKLDEFKSVYGISARQMISGDLTGMSMAQRDQLTQDMEMLEIENLVRFVIKKLEGMLYGKYIVTPTRKQFAPPEQITDASMLSATQDKIRNWLERAKHLIARNPDTRYTNQSWFFNTAEDITLENYKRVTGKTPPNELVTFWNEYNALRKKDIHAALVYLTESIELIDNTYDTLVSTLNRDYYERTKNDTNIYDFVIAKSIPAEKFFDPELLEMSVDARNQVFRHIFTSMDTQNRKVFRANITDALKQDVFKDDRAELEYLYQLSDWDIDNWLDILLEQYNRTGDIINPLTGEVLTDTHLGNLFAKICKKMRTNRRMVPLSEFIDISAFPTIDLEKVNVFFVDAGPGNAGWAAGNRITIDPHKCEDYFGTLVHEINHIMQAKYNMPNGFNVDSAYAMPDFLAYVVNHYPDYIKYTLYRGGYTAEIEIPNIGNVTEKDIKRMPSYLRNVLAHCGYMLVQGELWARAYTHNGKPVHGFAEIWSGIGATYLLAPDGKTKFEIRHDTSSHMSAQSAPKVSKTLAGSALDVAMQKLFLLKGRQEKEGYATTARNTFHSTLTRASAGSINSSIISDSISAIKKSFIRLTAIIKNPQEYLKKEILDKCNGDYSEGNVFYRIKEYVEENFKGISIDRLDSIQEEYVYVDDNAYDDFLLQSVLSKANSDAASIVRSYKAGEHIPLTAFYSVKELARLGVNPTAYVLISPNVKTQTIFDSKNRTGMIAIRANENTKDAKFIDTLNHEFRHLMQNYSGLATGFTPDFVVSKEMLDDIEKHTPELFKNDTIVKWAKSLDAKDWKTKIAQRVVYWTVSGELNAYAFNAKDLYVKPAYVTIEAGNPTIFMPWYNPKTGEGRYHTEFIAMRSDDSQETKGRFLLGPKGIEMPLVDKKAKKAEKTKMVEKKTTKKKTAEEIESDEVEKILVPAGRYFSKAKAKGTNLEKFTERGISQMDPDLQDFIIATTGHLDELPKALAHSIKTGILTKQALYKWFRKATDINEFTFDLLNEHIFKNEHISSMRELDELIVGDMVFYWAAARVLRREALGIENFVIENDAAAFKTFMNSLKGSEWKDKIDKEMEKYGDVKLQDNRGVWRNEKIAVTDKDMAYLRPFTMQWFDGSLASVFYIANTLIKVAKLAEVESRGLLSLDTKKSGGKGDKDVTPGDNVSQRNVLVQNDQLGNDILEIFERTTNKSFREMLAELVMVYTKQVFENANIAIPNDVDFVVLIKKYPELGKEIMSYAKKLRTIDPNTLSNMYAELVNAEMSDTEIDVDSFVTINNKQYKAVRKNIAQRIKYRADKLLAYVNDGRLSFKALPEDIQNMFEFSETKHEYVLKPEVYSVGRGRAKLPGETDREHRFNYPEKHDIRKSSAEFRHDVTNILQNEEKLINILGVLKDILKTQDKNNKALKKVMSRGEEAARTLADALKNIPKVITEEQKKMHSTEIKVSSKKKHLSDTPNVFNIMSSIDMPYVLHKIFDVSFAEMADTKVQFASRDKNGQLYDKEAFKSKEFDGMTEHEVSNWKAFYEVNRDTLLSLSRNEVLDIIEFFHRGAIVVGGPAGKLAAFEIFLLGYILDGARGNHNYWNFSQQEIDIIESLYRDKLSAHGIGLNAGKQMLDVVNPMKVIKQHMFDDWDAISDSDKDKLKKAVEELQRETDPKTATEKAALVVEMLSDFEKRQIEATQKKYPRWSKAWWRNFITWNKVKSFRYMGMLSGPSTWVRNSISNTFVLAFNTGADALAKIIFLPKGYAKDQWSLSGVKISTDVKNFIDAQVFNNPLFDPLYDMSSKYDPRDKKRIANEKQLFVSLIAKAYENKYAKEHRFDSKAMQKVSAFIDKRISDKRFVKFAVSRYFGKILTLELQEGNIDLSHGLSNDVLKLFAEAVILANQEYMHKRSFGADFLDGIRDKYPKTYEVLSFWQPFLNSSFNWFGETLKYTPLGLANSIVRMCRLEQQITKLDTKRASGEMVMDSRAAEFFARRDIGKGILGLILSGLGVFLAFSGRLRIEEDDEKFYAYIDENIKLDITNLFGSSSVLVGAAITQRWIKQKDGNTASWEDILSMTTDIILDGFFATDLLDRHKWGGTWDDLLTETESVLRSFIPQIWQTIIACTNDEGIRYSAGFKGMFERWFNTFVPTQPAGNRKINPYTGEIEDKYSMPIIGGLLQKGILGPKVYWVEVSEYERMCRELGVNKNELTGELTVGDNKYELDRLALNKKYGELNKESLAKIKSQKHRVEMPDGTFKTLSWDRMSDEQRANVLSRTFTRNAEIAKVYMWTQVIGKKFYASNSLWQILRQLGITKNVYKGDKGFAE